MIKIENTNNYIDQSGNVYYIKDQKIIKKKINYNKKYPTIRIKRQRFFVKNLVAKYFILNPNDYKYVLYKTDDYKDNSVSNLYYNKNNGSDKTGLIYKEYLGKVIGDFEVVENLKEVIKIANVKT